MVSASAGQSRLRPSALLLIVLLIAASISYLLWSPADLTAENGEGMESSASRAGAASLESGAARSEDFAVESVQRESGSLDLLEATSESTAPGVDRAWLDVQLIDVAGGDAANMQAIQLVDAQGAWPWPEIARGVTDETGKIRLNVPANRVMVLRADPGLPMQRARHRVWPLAEAESRAVELRLHAHITIRATVIVVDAQDNPVVGASITALEHEFKPVVTDAQGVAVLPGIPLFTSVFVRADADGFSPEFGLLDDQQVELQLTLKPEARLLGRVFGVGGEPAANAQVVLRSDPLAHRVWSSRTLIEWVTHADEQGRYQVNGLPVGVRLLVSAGLDDARTVVTTPKMTAGAQFLDLSLVEVSSLSGRAIDPDGVGVVGIVMELEPIHELRPDVSPSPSLTVLRAHQAVTDGDGKFVFGPELGLHAGRWKLGLLDSMNRGVRHSGDVAPSYRWLPQLLELELAPGEQKKDVLIQLRAGASIAGFLLDPQGNPVKSGVVRAFPTDFGNRTRVQTSEFGEDGSFSLGPLGEGMYAVRGNDPANVASVSVKQVASGTTGLILQCRASRGVIGVVVDAAGQPTQARLHGYDRAVADSTMWGLRVDGDGHFSVFDNSAKFIDLIAFLPDGRAGIAANVKLEESPKEIRIQLEDAVAVRIDVRGIDSEQVVGIVDFRGQRIFEGDPWFLENLIWLPEGDLHVELREAGRLLVEADALLLQGGEPVRLNLHVPEQSGD